MTYRWNDLAFDVDASWTDLTMLTFVDRPSAPTYHLTLTREPREATLFAAWVDAQLQDVRAQAAGFESLSRDGRDLPAGPAVVSVHRFRGSGDAGVRQTQVFVDRGREAWILTLSHADRDDPAAAAALANLLESLRVVPAAQPG